MGHISKEKNSKNEVVGWRDWKMPHTTKYNINFIKIHRYKSLICALQTCRTIIITYFKSSFNFRTDLGMSIVLALALEYCLYVADYLGRL